MYSVDLCAKHGNGVVGDALLDMVRYVCQVHGLIW